MRPLEVQRREEAKNRRGSGVLFPGGESGIFDQDERERRARPNPARGNQKLTGYKRKATGPPDPENPQARRKPPPKPEGRLDRKGNTKKKK